MCPSARKSYHRAGRRPESGGRSGAGGLARASPASASARRRPTPRPRGPGPSRRSSWPEELMPVELDGADRTTGAGLVDVRRQRHRQRVPEAPSSARTASTPRGRAARCPRRRAVDDSSAGGDVLARRARPIGPGSSRSRPDRRLLDGATTARRDGGAARADREPGDTRKRDDQGAGNAVDHGTYAK